MNGLLLTGGEGPERRHIEHILAGSAFVVAADSGLDLARRLDIDPDLILGDMDSLSDPSVLRGYPDGKIRIYPRDKDETDTELGLRCLRERGFTDIVIAGGGGGRLDHLVALLSLFERDESPNRWYTGREEIILIRDRLRFECRPGELVSFFPVGEETATMTSMGLNWELDGLVWRRGSVGISNRTISDRVTVEMRTGRLIMIRNLDRRAPV